MPEYTKWTIRIVPDEDCWAVDIMRTPLERRRVFEVINNRAVDAETCAGAVAAFLSTSVDEILQVVWDHTRPSEDRLN